MGFAGGDPGALTDGAGLLTGLSDHLADDAFALAALGRRESAAAGDPQVAQVLETALATTGGVLVAATALTHGLAVGVREAGRQLTTATGPR